jgi:GR25 family glycosyltransferase involved in LPS biosynthesis
MKLTDFDKIYCLCLDEREEYWPELERQFAERGAHIEQFICGKGKLFDPKQYDYIDKDIPADNQWDWKQFTKNAYHCHQTHRKILEKIVEQGKPHHTYLLLEDDCQLQPNFDKVLEEASRQMDELKLDWDLFYLGVNIYWSSVNQVSKNILKLNNGAYCFHCIGLKQPMAKILLDQKPVGPFDYIASTVIQPKYNCYAVWPTIAWQRKGWSNVNQAFEDYTKYFNNKGNNIIT